MRAQVKDTTAAAAVLGMTWIFVSNVLIRVIGLLGQIAIGWLLLPADFGVYALAVSMLTFIAALRSGGVTQVAIQRGAEFSGSAKLYFRYALAFNLLAMSILLGIAIPYLVHSSAVGMILVGMALAIPISTQGTISRIKLTMEQRFREISAVSLWSAIIWQGGIVCFALLGFGSKSFILPPIMQAIYESVACWWYTKSDIPATNQINRSEYIRIFKDARWIMLSAATLALATTGDYFAVGMLTNPVTVGIYFFAFQLVAAVCVPISSSIESVLPAILTPLNSDKERQLKAYFKTVRTIIVTSLPLACVFALLAPLAMHIIWRGKWDVAAAVTQTLAVCIPAWLLVSTTRALLEAQGLWRSRFVLLMLYGVGGVSSAAIGSLLGDVQTIALSVTLFYTSFSLVVQMVVVMATDNRWSYCKQLLLPVIFNAFILWACILISEQILVSKYQWFMPCLKSTMFIAMSGVLNLLLFKCVWNDLVVVLLKRSAQRQGN